MDRRCYLQVSHSVIRWLATDSDPGDNQYGPSPKPTLHYS
jgi:hypothetical protein